ncbi:hypothetical protein [Acidocella sp.]|jgi:hypothetical protein|uniref:hypothetical protein n=1 Tax=Acidocella sp. TaxID=50710 RepID=UPI002F428699
MNRKFSRDFTSWLGTACWDERVAWIRARVQAGARNGKLAAQRFLVESALEKSRRGHALSAAESTLVELTSRIPALHWQLTAAGQARLREMVEAALVGEVTLLPVLHLLHTARLQEERGFTVAYTGFEEATPFDLLISRDGEQAEIACDSVSAEDGHAVHRSSWTQLMDRVDPDLQTWLAAHPGRYLLKMTLPKGLKNDAENLPALHGKIRDFLTAAKRADYDEAAILRLDPLLLAGAQASDKTGGILAKLRRDFGPEAHFAATEAGTSLFVMAARGGMENDVAALVRRRLAAIAPARLTGTRPGILAICIADTDQLEWQSLRDQLRLEGEARQFLTFPEAKPVVAVTFASRYELAKAGAPEGDLRFRNPMHPEAKSAALAPAVLSTV